MICGEIAMRPARSPRIDGHRREQHRRALDRQTRIGQAEAVDPVDLREEPDHLAERQDDADQEHADDEGVEPGIGAEGFPDLAIEDDDHEPAEHEEDQHPKEVDAGRGELERIDVARHEACLSNRIRSQYGIEAAGKHEVRRLRVESTRVVRVR